MTYILIFYIAETAWDIISDFATELLEGPDKERVSTRYIILRIKLGKYS